MNYYHLRNTSLLYLGCCSRLQGCPYCIWGPANSHFAVDGFIS